MTIYKQTTVEDGMGRDYKKEYRDFHGTEKQKKLRALRNTARRQSGLKKGDSREVHHVKPLRSGGSNCKSNRRVVSQHRNRSMNGR